MQNSGQVISHELVEILKELKPKKLIPVHTEYPNIFKKYFEKTIQVELPTKNQTMKILQKT
ncbi:MAG: MBL fold metallo-hydrolase RNA specificity domain-containing protein [Candidatus Jordarchaeum sp.]|uniref:MBL fold metallo-hydrolase RNA specificity domain-containing protein n=1 Tax=Candidatus Jordarchaeum sp. TaxID=2823881 RepID=UPI0040498E86